MPAWMVIVMAVLPIAKAAVIDIEALIASGDIAKAEAVLMGQVEMVKHLFSAIGASHASHTAAIAAAVPVPKLDPPA